MGYLVKLLDSNEYFIPSEDGDVTTTADRGLDRQIGVFGSYDEANDTAQTFSKDMILDRDYSIEKI